MPNARLTKKCRNRPSSERRTRAAELAWGAGPCVNRTSRAPFVNFRSEPVMSRCLRLLRLVVLLGAAAAIGTGASAQQPAGAPPAAKTPQAAPAPKDPVVAVVN